MKKIVFVLLFAIVFFEGNAQSNKVNITLSGGYPSTQLKSKIETNTSDLLTRINDAIAQEQETLTLNPQTISSVGMASILACWEPTRFYCTPQTLKIPLIKISSGYELRNIPIKIDTSSHEIVIEFDKNGIINDLYFALSKHELNMMSGNKVEDKTREKIILNFMEILKTAYIKKDADFIETMYSDKALIIVGKKIEKSNIDNMSFIQSDKEVAFYNNATYKKMTKTEYMDGLKKVFKSNKNIDIQFEDITVSQHKKSDLKNFYGVKLTQHWKGDSYNDVGYLFFAIEFRDNDNPIIWVRAWQDTNETQPIHRFGLEDLDIDSSK